MADMTKSFRNHRSDCIVFELDQQPKALNRGQLNQMNTDLTPTNLDGKLSARSSKSLSSCTFFSPHQTKFEALILPHMMNVR
jgi:hypothetical protein